MTHWLIDPFQADMVLRALVAGVIAACLCSLVGCWVLLRRSVFLGEAMTHGMLPGVAIAALLGVSLMAGGLVAALVMAFGVAAIGRSSKLASDTSIGLLLVGMLALGVIVVSRSQSFAVDLTGFLFGDVFAVRTNDLVVLAVALLLTFVAVVAGHRAFVAVTFDPRKAATLGLRPNLAIPAMTVLMAVAMVASFHVVGTLLVLGLLVAPPAAALMWARSIPRVMVLSAVIGSAAVYLGLMISWYAGTAGERPSPVSRCCCSSPRPRSHCCATAGSPSRPSPPRRWSRWAVPARNRPRRRRRPPRPQPATGWTSKTAPAKSTVR